MSFHNFLNNFASGFATGMFNMSPFCNNFFSSFNYCMPFNNIFNAFPSNMFLYPSINSCFPTMLNPPSPMPMPTIPNIDIDNIFTQASPFMTYTQPDFKMSQLNNIDIFEKYSTISVNTAQAKTTTNPKAKILGHSINEQYYDKMLEYILSQEGGYVNDPVDSGGATNKGVTQNTYNGYRRKKNLPTRSVKQITHNELREIYHDFFTQSGADKINNPRMALMVFDVAVGSGVSRAKEMFRESGGDINKFISLRKEFYSDIVRRKPKQKKFIKGWNNRIQHAKEFANANFPNSSALT